MVPLGTCLLRLSSRLFRRSLGFSSEKAYVPSHFFIPPRAQCEGRLKNCSKHDKFFSCISVNSSDRVFYIRDDISANPAPSPFLRCKDVRLHVPAHTSIRRTRRSRRGINFATWQASPRAVEGPRICPRTTPLSTRGHLGRILTPVSPSPVSTVGPAICYKFMALIWF
jgi:hypothetical protein